MSASNADTPVIHTTSGELRGKWDGGLAVFLGVPYAAAPAGDLRFRPPHPHPKWHGVRDAIAVGPAAPQPASRADLMAVLTGAPPFAQGEDNCLTLNIWSPGLGDQPRPVLVWVHGSGGGTGGWAGYAGARLAADGGIVVVTINYRLGPFGFLYLPELADGNMGLLDQIAALRWVRDNIAAFGGDPDLVTFGGVSGGAVSAAALMGSPLASGLFRRAILQSGPLGLPALSPDEATRVAVSFLSLPDLTPASADELRALPAERLVAAYRQLIAQQRQRRFGNLAPSMQPVAGGAGLPGAIMPAIAAGAGRDIDVLIGTTGEEITPFLVFDPDLQAIGRERVVEVLGSYFSDAEVAYDHYAARRPGATPGQVLIDGLSARLHRLPALRVAEAQAEHGHPAYVYQFDWRSPGRGGAFGACHTIELPFLFGSFAAWADSPIWNDVDPAPLEPLARTFRGALAAFVRTGSPNAAGLPRWDPYTTPGRMTMHFDTLTMPINDLAGGERRL